MKQYKENPNKVSIRANAWKNYTVSWNTEKGRKKIRCTSYPEAIRIAESHGAVL